MPALHPGPCNLAPRASKCSLVLLGGGRALGVGVASTGQGRRIHCSAFWAQMAAAVTALQHQPRWHSPAVLPARRDQQPLQNLNYSAQARPIC